MEIGAVTSAPVIDPAAALAADAAPDAAAADGVEPGMPPPAGSDEAPVQRDIASTLVRGGFVERVLGEAQPATTSAPAPVPGERADKNVETNQMQTFARPHTPSTEQPKPLVNALPTAQHQASEFAVPAAQLLPATLIGLQVEQAMQFPLNARGFEPDPRPLFEARVHERRERQHDEDTFYDEAPDEDTQHDEPRTDEHETVVIVPAFDAAADDAWLAALTRTVRAALQAKTLPQALAAAAEQWQRGRCAVLASPQGTDPAGAAWAFVLWPAKAVKPGPARAAQSLADTLTLQGTRVEARLQWSAQPNRPLWFHTRMVKSHHPRTGRQLVPASPDAARLPCEVQLGPVLARVLRPCDVCLRIGSVQRFWRALGNQWSLVVAVSTLPLVDR